MTVQAVVFDLDGTLIDSYDAIAEALNHALNAAGRAPLAHERVRGMVGHGLESLVERALGPEGVADGVRRFRERYARIFLERTRLLDGVVDTVAELAARGYRMGVASNKPARFGRPILEHLGIASYLGGILGPDRVSRAKPHPEMVETLLAMLEVEASRAVYVGDMPVDVETCRNAGIPCWLVPTGSSDVEELRTAGGDRLLDRFPDLLDLLPDLRRTA